MYPKYRPNLAGSPFLSAFQHIQRPLKPTANAIDLALAIVEADRLNVQQVGIGGGELHTVEGFVEIGMPVAQGINGIDKAISGFRYEWESDNRNAKILISLEPEILVILQGPISFEQSPECRWKFFPQ